MAKPNKKQTTGSKTSNKKNKKNNEKILLESDNEYSSDNKKISKRKTSKDIPEEDKIDFQKKYEDILDKLRDNYLEQKRLMQEIRELRNLHQTEVRLASKTGKRSNSGKHTGFNKPEPIPECLKNLLDIKEELLPRSTVTKIIYQYFKDNKMCNFASKKQIVPNKKIKKIFGMKEGDVMDFYNLQTWLKKVYKENNNGNHVLDLDD